MENVLNRIKDISPLKYIYDIFIKYSAIIKKNSLRIFPYCLIFLVALFLCVLTFKAGYYDGHDSIFHHINIMSYYNSLISGDYVGYMSNTILNNFGTSIRMFYSTFAHTITALVGKMIIPLGFTMTTAMKLVNFGSFLFSGIFSYWLGKAIFKDNKILAFTLAIGYMANPYKITDVYIRQAFAENFASTFIPLFFYALYRIVHEEEIDLSSYMLLALSTALILLSHYITALYTVCFGVIYVIMRLSYLVNKFSKKEFYIYAIGAVLAVVIVFLPKAIPLLIQNTDDVFIRLFMDVQGTNLESVTNEVDRSSLFFMAGFNKSRFYTNLITVCTGLGLTMLANFFFPKKWYSFLPLYGSVIVLTIIFGVNYKSPVHATVIFFIGTFVVLSTYLHISINQKEKYVGVFELISWIVLFALSLVLILSKPIWEYMPSIFYEIQFPWRLWFYAVLFGGVAVLGTVSYVIKIFKPAIMIFPALSLLLFTSNQCLNNESVYQYGMDNAVENVNMDSIYGTGWQLEYMNDYYVSIWLRETHSPLYHNMRRWLSNQNYEYTYIPYISDESEVKDYSYALAKDGATFEVEALNSSKVTVYMPLFYYEGYKASVKTNDGQTKDLKVYAVDGLVSFDLEDTGYITVKFVGTSLMTSTMMVTQIMVPVMTLGASLYFIIKKSKKDDKEIFKEIKL